MRRIFLLAFAGFLLLAGAWAGALPANGTYDESQHIVRAYAAVDGQWRPHGPNRQSYKIPATLLPSDPECMRESDDPKPATCLVARPSSPAEVSVETYVARYNPVYYLAVGLPLKLSPDLTGIVMSRLLSALLCALMLGASVWLAVLAGRRLLAAAVVLVATPMVVNLAGSLNPNGMEICAAVLLFTSLLCREAHRTALVWAGVAAFALITVRHIGPVLIVIDLAAVALFVGVWALRRDLRGWLGGGVLAGLVVFGAWVLAARSPVGAGPGSASDLGVGGIVRGLFAHRFEFYIKQIVGQFGYGETTISPLAILYWYGLVAVIVVPALWFATWRARSVIVGLVAAGFGMLVALEFYFVPKANWFSHGRYALPILVGAVLIAAFVLDGQPFATRLPSRLPRWLPRWLPVILVAATAPVHLYALVRVLSRYRVNIETSFSPFGGGWSPPVNASVVLLSLLVGVGLLVWTTLPVTDSDETGTDIRDSTRTVPAD
ncbi:hypothetical protein GCM10009557_58520 [Virgisporangium ochraceum]|uniref:DUF2142 domain-containing protein n=1 Tax=Virgisporangium ochraceum TaxID=65505 RepID=A0A8J4E8E9_9ACTN|nr:DUF2142 domain-containing protein [Virgisporangium ochraceum]GIJ66100.1 hypothetical protein Voc01_010170 [Virgisporangium ochraceum]